MGNRVMVRLVVLALVVSYGVMAMGYIEDDPDDPDWGREKEEGDESRSDSGRSSEDEPRGAEEEEVTGPDGFLLQQSKQVVRTDAGEMTVLKSVGGRAMDRPMHIGFITMEPQSLFIPQYLDSSLVLFVRRGDAKVGMLYKDKLGERKLKAGDVYRIPAGSVFYLLNTGVGQRLHIILSIDTSEGLRLGTLQSFFIGGGTNPQSVLSGFDPEILSSAFNVSSSELKDVLTRQQDGGIVYVNDSRSPSIWKKFLELKEEDKVQEMKRMVEFPQQRQQQQQQQQQEQTATWSWRKLLNSVFGNGNKKQAEDFKGTGNSPDSYNVYKKSPDFKNDYGWSLALDGSDYSQLKHSGIGVFLVNLTAGSMMAPHVNPTATEYGVVLRGSGTIQVVFPNGTSAMNAKVQEGDVFWVPRYFPFCQIASRTGPLEFFGFTTSARKNRPQFLVGASSVLRTLRGPELAAAFGVTEDRLQRFVTAQKEAVILPSAKVAPPYKEDRETKPEQEERETKQKEEGRETRPKDEGRETRPKDEGRETRPTEQEQEEEVVNKFERLPNVIKSFGNDMVMGFD